MTRIRPLTAPFFAVLLVPLLLFTSTASASLSKYRIDFAPHAGDPDGGIGSFLWDDDTQLVSNLTWDFGPGLTGGANPDWTESLGTSGTMSQFFFEVMTVTDVAPATCTEVGANCAAPFSLSEGLYGWPGTQMIFQLVSDNTQWYSIVDPAFITSGRFSTSLVSVPAPATLLLFGLGLAGLGFGMRRR